MLLTAGPSPDDLLAAARQGGDGPLGLLLSLAMAYYVLRMYLLLARRRGIRNEA